MLNVIPNLRISKAFNINKKFCSLHSFILFYITRKISIRSLLHDMPKNKVVPSELKEIRLKERNSYKTRAPPSEIYLAVLGNGAKSSRSLYMFTDHGRYLFNCGEGTQRLAHEYKMKFSKLDNVFITYKSWENLGGLLGLSLTLQDIGVPEITLHGPPNIETLYENADSFILTKDFSIVKKSDMDQPHVDSCMEVRYISIKSKKMQPSLNTPVVYVNDRAKKLRLTELEFIPDEAIAYVCKGHNKPGHLLYEKCIEQGVPPGPLLGELKNGKDVTLESGKVVYSKDVVSEDQRCPVFLVVECPSEDFLDSFVNEEKFMAYQINAKVPSDIASLVVHFTPSYIFQSNKYQQWMKRFPDTTIHLILNADNATLNSIAIHRIQHKLNLLHPGIFKLLQENEHKELDLENSITNVIQSNTLDRFYIRPSKGLDRSYQVTLDPQSYIKEAMDAKGFKESLSQLHNNIELISNSASNKDDIYPEIVFLGTGSSIPSKVRNVSAILINTQKDEHILMDCGEGTYGQLLRFYDDNVTNILDKLSCIFISHMHADHHLGLIQILKSRQISFKNKDSEYLPLLLIGPKKLNSWLERYHKFEPITHLYRFLKCSSLEHDGINFPGSLSDLLEGANYYQDVNISTVPVTHCPDAHGLILTHKSFKWKIVYSGDTVPCEKLAIAGKDCSLLIHEASMEDELANEAAIKRHSTTSEAIKMGEKMNAKFTILTHFSQRYAKVPVFSEQFSKNIGCAFDNMKVCHNELSILPLFIPPLKCLFAEDVEELQNKSYKRRQKLKVLTNSIKAAL